MTDLDPRLSALSPAKRALLGRLRAQSSGSSPIPRIADGPAPLSAEQRRLWYLLQMAPGYPVYTIPLGFRLRGPLDVEALAGALRDLVARHETLRTAFRESAGEPVQTVGDDAAFELEVVDLRGDPWAEAEANYQTDAFARRGFDLERGETFRALLLREGDGEHRLLLGAHHLAADGWSMGVLLRELSVLYAARAAGTAARLPELPVRFRDWAAWQGRPDDPAREADEAYWRAELAGAPVGVEVPPDLPRPPLQEWEGAKHPFEIPAPLTDALRALARREGTTLYAVVMAAYALLLGRYAGEDDLLLGTVLANRPHPLLEPLVGFFANTLPLRVRLEGDPTAAELVRRVHRAALGVQEHAGLPFDRIVELAGVRRDFSRPPLVQAVLGFADAPSRALALPGVAAGPLPLDSRTSAFELSLLVEDGGGTLPAAFQYATSLYEPATVARMARHLEGILTAFAAPDRRLSEVPLATGDELRALAAWGRGAPPPSDAPCVHRRFEERARIAPHAPAVVGEDGATSYAELNARANRVAHALRRRGVGPEVRVGVCLPPSAEAIAAVLGALKAGGAYVPLDPDYPEERLAYLLDDSDVAVLLTRRGVRDGLPAFGGRALLLDDEGEGIGRESDADPEPAAAPENLAYVIYTSGSTGRPKGVAVEHRSLAATLLTAGAAFGFGPGDAMPVLASSAFDIWLFEALLPLLAGAAVRPVPRERVTEVDRLAAELESATLLHAVPALMREIVRAVRASGSGTLPRLRRAFVGGDAVPPDLLAEMREAFPAAEIRVLYGPTEATILCAAHPVEDGEAGGRRLIGGPLGNAVLHVLDPGGRAVPPGVSGELCVGGAAVARGYLGRPGLTAERFVPDPSGAPGGRLYRTGDRARWSANGTLEFLGRLDSQVKIRGFRIEPGEVEALLAAHPAVRDAVVVARDDPPGERRLAGYVVPSHGAVSVEALRGYLEERLPGYMVPSALVALDALPLAPNGKLDRRALPAPGEVGGAGYVAPRTPAEEALARLWCEVLGVERVGVHDDFFELGGQSILAVRLLARVRGELGVDLTAAELLQGSTLERMAQAVAGRRQRARLPLVPLQPFGGCSPLFLAHPAGGHVLCYRELAVLLAPEHPVYALQPRGIEAGEEPLDTVEALAAHYVEAIRAFRPDGPYRLGGWSFGGAVAWEMARQLDAAGAEVELLALIDTGPQTPEAISIDPRDPAEVVWQTVAALAGWPAAMRVEVDRIRGGEPREMALTMIRLMDAPRLLPESRVDEVLRLIAVRGANLRAQADYRPRPYRGHLTYIRTAGSEHTRAHAPGLDYWSALARGGTTEHRVSGSHGTLLQEPHVRWVAEVLRG
ncbi:MAG TPA: amino acid adenylation domain-containing protein [Longimicrobiaceae bacterium]|nr:amino acid adenylation domain-containing protein [Longimicrobiaceae bacterium]